MRPVPSGSFNTRLKALREAAGYTQEELATIAGLSVHAVSAHDDPMSRRFERCPRLSTWQVRAVTR
jgi:hypothetical protein